MSKNKVSGKKKIKLEEDGCCCHPSCMLMELHDILLDVAFNLHQLADQIDNDEPLESFQMTDMEGKIAAVEKHLAAKASIGQPRRTIKK